MLPTGAANTMRAGRLEELAMHPTVKPVTALSRERRASTAAMDSPLTKGAPMRVLIVIFAAFVLAAVTWSNMPVAKQYDTASLSIDPTGLTVTKTNLPA